MTARIITAAAIAALLLTGTAFAAPKPAQNSMEPAKLLTAQETEATAAPTEPAPAESPSPTEPAPTAPLATEAPKSSRISAEEAKAVALNHAGLQASDVRGLRAEFDYDDGRPEYEVEFRAGGYEYDYEIHAETGKILKWEKEYDDEMGG